MDNAAAVQASDQTSRRPEVIRIVGPGDLHWAAGEILTDQRVTFDADQPRNARHLIEHGQRARFACKQAPRQPPHRRMRGARIAPDGLDRAVTELLGPAEYVLFQ